MKKSFIFSLLIFFTSFADAGKIYLAAGPNLAFPVSARIQLGELEYGLLTWNTGGFAKTFQSDYRYTSIGIGSDGRGFGLFGAWGVISPRLFGFAVRAELNAVVQFNSSGTGIGLVGIDWEY
ncbi:MAG: hypothetical protein AB8E15_07330 [Bdellovibrionales bacterium]